MKKLLLLLIIPFLSFGQQTYIPNDVFEQYLINAGLDDDMDNYVLTSNINTISSIYFYTNYIMICLLYTSPSPRDKRQSRMPSSA